MFPVSAFYVWLNLHIAPKAAEGPYAMHFDGALPVTLAKYWLWAPGALRLGDIVAGSFWAWFGTAVAWVVSLSLLGFLAWRLRQRRWLAGFFLLWFLFIIGPLLPLRDHFSDYYLTVPTIGLALAGAWAIQAAWKTRGWRLLLAGTIAAAYLIAAIPVSRFTVHWGLERSLNTRRLVLSVGRAQTLHPGKIILLDGVGPDLFWSAVADKPFPLVGAPQVFLTPDSEDRIGSAPPAFASADYVLPTAAVLRGLREDRIVVYQLGEGPLRNITSSFSTLANLRWKQEPASGVDVGQELLADQLGEGWYPIEGGYRWMGKTAVVRLAGPSSPEQRLYVTGYVSEEALANGPIALTVTVDGRTLSTAAVTVPNARFDFDFPLPADLVGHELVDVRLSVDRTFTPPSESRELGLAFGVISIR